MFTPAQLVEVAGTLEEGFPGSWVSAVIVEDLQTNGVKVVYLEVSGAGASRHTTATYAGLFC